MAISANITKRIRTRKLVSGASVLQTRWVLNYREPRSGKRRQLFFERHKDALERRNQILADVEQGNYSHEHKRAVTIAEAVRRWLDDREGEVKRGTMRGYRQAAALIIGPLLIGTARDRCEFKITGKKAAGARIIPLLGGVKLVELTTSDIRAWHK